MDILIPKNLPPGEVMDTLLVGLTEALRFHRKKGVKELSGILLPSILEAQLYAYARENASLYLARTYPSKDPLIPEWKEAENEKEARRTAKRWGFPFTRLWLRGVPVLTSDLLGDGQFPEEYWICYF